MCVVGVVHTCVICVIVPEAYTITSTHGPPANVATLPTPISCTYVSILVPSGPFGLAEQRLLQQAVVLIKKLP